MFFIKRSLKCLACCGLFLCVVIITPAHAYLDPGSGSAILQGLLAAIVAVGITAKLYWHKILVFLKVRKKTEFSETKLKSETKPVRDDSK
jgi:hypothetical protein